jgi:3-hydroxyacyl-CoA dehydrogenase / enoyl-CoA hydratase / 3-hydroxybutyryl-CoA epimerase / enoyl-CoA isomerase
MCGMHFFMPVDQRALVEIVRGELTSQATIDQAISHVKRIGKDPLQAADGPGFIVNRLLSPYLNQAMLLLSCGIEADAIQSAALSYGMPLSPLELIDWIGTRTMFDAGRVYWQSFPNRLDPSPILPALLKQQRLGRASQGGFYDYVHGQRSRRLAALTMQVSEKYQRETLQCDQATLIQLLAIPMWIEAAIAYREGTIQSPDDFNRAMRGGLGYQRSSWLGFFDELGSRSIEQAIERFSQKFKSMIAPPDILTALATQSPSQVICQKQSDNSG